MARQKVLLALLAVGALFTAAVPAPASAQGDASDPDMEDSAGDQVSSRDARDLIAGWVGNETETTFELNLQTQALEPFTPYTDWQNLPVVYYEFFFDVVTPQGTESYEARATVPVHGPFAALTTYDLFSVTYGVGGTVANETTQGAPVGRYLVSDGIVSFTVDKVQVGDPARGDVIEGIWARIRSASQRNAGDSITEDTMLSHLTPGRSTTLSGGVTFYSVTVASAVTSANATFDDPARFTVTIHSSSEKVANVSLKNSSALPSNWTMSTDKPVYVVEPGADATAIVTITPGGNTTNVTRRITVAGQFRDDQNTTRSSENTVTLSVFVPPPAGPGGGGTCTGPNCPAAGGDIMAVVPYAAAGAAGLAALGAVFGLVLPRRRKARAKAAFERVQQLKLAKGPRSGMPTGRPPVPGAPGRPGAPPAGRPPKPGGARPAAPRPGMPPRPGAAPGGGAPPTPRRR
jgi:hypothetical protein